MLSLLLLPLALAAPVSTLNGSEGGNVTITAANSTGASYIGALFKPGATLGPTTHSCTANVIKSDRGDLVLTAAHCTHGTMANYTFVPDWSEGKAPYGVWTVTEAFVTTAWQSSQDPQNDFAILRVAPQVIRGHTRSLESVTGAVTVAAAPRAGAKMTDIAYNDGTAQPVVCSAPVYYYDGYPAFDCGGFVGGSSGSGWVTRGHKLVGVIGGLHQGGCLPSTSYSSTFGRDIFKLIARASSGAAGDSVVKAGSDGCE